VHRRNRTDDCKHKHYKSSNAAAAGPKRRSIESKRSSKPKALKNTATRDSVASKYAPPPAGEELLDNDNDTVVTKNDKLEASVRKTLSKSVQRALAQLAPYNDPGKETDGDNAFILSNALSSCTRRGSRTKRRGV